MPFTEIADLMDFDYADMNGYDVIVAGLPCECFSVAAFGHHWNPGYRPRTKQAKMAIRLTSHVFDLMTHTDAKYWVIENPRGLMRKIIMPPNKTTWWCRWGDERAKPTDLWGVFPPSLDFPEPCKNNNPDCHHERARRGAKSGTQGRRNAAERSIIPIQFSRALAEACDRAWAPPLGGYVSDSEGS